MSAPGALRGACSGRSKSRALASNHGIAFRRARGNQAHGIPQTATFCFVFSPLLLSLKKYRSGPHKARQPRQNRRASSFSLYDSHERSLFLCACASMRVCISYSIRNLKHSLQKRGALSALTHFLFCHSVLLLCEPTSHRKLTSHKGRSRSRRIRL